MNPIFKLLIISLVLTAALHAQAPELGFIRIVNAVAPGTGNSTFLLDGRNLFKDGYKLGQDTGGYGVKAGSREIEVRKEGVETGSTRVKLGIGETMTVIAFAEKISSKNEEDPPRWEIKLLRLRQQDPERGYGLSFVSVCNDQETPVQLMIEGREAVMPVFARRLAITKIGIGGRQVEAGVMLGERKLTHISTDSPGNYVVILYENADGQVEALSFYDPKFVIAG